MNIHGSEGFQTKHPNIWDLIFNLAVISKSVVFVDEKIGLFFTLRFLAYFL